MIDRLVISWLAGWLGSHCVERFAAISRTCSLYFNKLFLFIITGSVFVHQNEAGDAGRCHSGCCTECPVNNDHLVLS